jgi:hypothetical protein
MKLNVCDVSSRHAQRTKGITVERLDQYDEQAGERREALVEDKHAGPADTATARIDVAACFRSLGRTKRRSAKLLARGRGKEVRAVAGADQPVAGGAAAVVAGEFQGGPVAAA